MNINSSLSDISIAAAMREHRLSSRRHFSFSNSRRDMIRSRSRRSVRCASSHSANRNETSSSSSKPTRTKSLSDRLIRSQSCNSHLNQEAIGYQQKTHLKRIISSDRKQKQLLINKNQVYDKQEDEDKYFLEKKVETEEEEDVPFSDAFGENVFAIDPHMDHSTGDFIGWDNESKKQQQSTNAGAMSKTKVPTRRRTPFVEAQEIKGGSDHRTRLQQRMRKSLPNRRSNTAGTRLANSNSKNQGMSQSLFQGSSTSSYLKKIEPTRQRSAGSTNRERSSRYLEAQQSSL